jgi:phosphate:Na+ symporter
LVAGLIVKPDNQTLLVEIRNQGVRITQAVREFRSSHWNHLAEAHDEPLVSTTYTDMLGAYRKIKEHLVATAETIAAPVI